MTPAMCHVEESHSTLRFACRAKRVVNNAVVNEVMSDAAVLKRQAKEIEELKKRLAVSGRVLGLGGACACVRRCARSFVCGCVSGETDGGRTALQSQALLHACHAKRKA